MATKPKTTTSAGTTMSPMDMVQNPNFSSLMRNQDYFNTLAQLVADRQARGEMPGLMPIGGTGITEEQKKRLSPEERRNLDEAIAMRQSGLGGPNYQAPNRPIATTGSAMPQAGSNITQMEPIPSQDEINKRMEFIRTLNENPRIQEFRRIPPPQIANQQGVFQMPAQQPLSANVPVVNQSAQLMPQMQNYNQMLQQGMRRNQDMNQAAQNLAAPAGPARSFSQVAGRTRRTPMPRPPVNNSLAPSNRRLI
jgi:hypothetical protein